MGEKNDNILNTLLLTEQHHKEYKTVKAVFENHFIGKQNAMNEQSLIADVSSWASQRKVLLLLMCINWHNIVNTVH